MIVEPVYQYFVSNGMISPDMLYAEGEAIQEAVYIWSKPERINEEAIHILSDFTNEFVKQGKMDALLKGHSVESAHVDQ